MNEWDTFALGAAFGSCLTVIVLLLLSSSSSASPPNASTESASSHMTFSHPVEISIQGNGNQTAHCHAELTALFCEVVK